MHLLQCLGHESHRGAAREIDRERNREQRDEAARVRRCERQNRLPPRRAFRCQRLEALGLRQAAPKPREPDERQRAERIQRAPAERNVVHERERDRGGAVSERAERTQQPEPEAAILRREFFRDDDDRDRGLRVQEAAAQALQRDELERRARERGQKSGDGVANHRNQQQPAPADAVREHAQHQREQHARANRRGDDANLVFGDAEARLDLHHQNREQADVVVVDELGGAEQPEHFPAAHRQLRHARRPRHDAGPARWAHARVVGIRRRRCAQLSVAPD